MSVWLIIKIFKTVPNDQVNPWKKTFMVIYDFSTDRENLNSWSRRQRQDLEEISINNKHNKETVLR